MAHGADDAGVWGVARGGVGACGYLLIELPVVKAGKGAVLVDHARNGIGERGVFNAVEHYRAHSHLTEIRLAARLGGYYTREQVVIV